MELKSSQIVKGEKTMKTINELSKEWYGKDYDQLPDDGVEQDFIAGLFSNQVA